MKKKLLALLLCLTLLLVMLPTVALADGEEGGFTPKFTILTHVVLNGTTELPANANFSFNLADDAEEQKPLDYYGITIQENELAISRDLFAKQPAGDYHAQKEITASIDLDYIYTTWTPLYAAQAGPNDSPISYSKTFRLNEVNGGNEGWVYDATTYYLTFKHEVNSRQVTCTIHTAEGIEITWSSNGFENSYTANNSSIVVTVPETTEAAPNPTTGAAPANLGLGCMVIGLVAMGAVVCARKK